MSLLNELRRRNVFRVAAAYLIASWLIIQVVSAVDAPLKLPDWFDTVVIVLLAIGFPIAALFAWAFELTPDGIKATQPEAPPADGRSSTRLDHALVGMLVIVAGMILWNQLGAPRDEEHAARAEVPADKSIAVLPFVDMSPSGDQGYFADGIAEELLNELTRLEGLRVASRTSSFSFRGGNADIRTIGEALDVSMVLEGSVRKDGDRIRITAQLIDSGDGYHYWSQTYDRNLKDIFSIQDEIADGIAGVLGVQLGVGDVNSFAGAGTNSVEAYETYLRAIAMPMGSIDQYRELERAIQIDPDYAAALAALGLGIASTMWTSQPEEAPEILDRALPLLFKAVEVRSDSAYAYSLLATAYYARFDWTQSEHYYERALDLSGDGRTLNHYANMLMRTGRAEAAIRNYSKAKAAARYPVTWNGLAQNAYLATQRFAALTENISDRPDADYLRYLLAINQGDIAALEVAIRSLPGNSTQAVELFAPLLGMLESPDEALALLRSVHANAATVWPSKYHDIALLAAFYEDPDFALKVFAKEARLTTIRYGAFWYPVMSNVRQLPAFKELMQDVNLVEYWRKHGWPDHCRPLGENDFECF